VKSITSSTLPLFLFARSHAADRCVTFMKLTFTFIKWSPFPQNFKAADNSYVLATRLLQSSQSIADDAAPYDRLRALRPVRNATTKTPTGDAGGLRG
jgi:hypothetical protein